MSKIRIKFLTHGEFVGKVNEDFLQLSPEQQLIAVRKLLHKLSVTEFLKAIFNERCGLDNESVQVPLDAIHELQNDTQVSFIGKEESGAEVLGDQEPIVVREDWDAYWKNGFDSPIIYPI